MENNKNVKNVYGELTEEQRRKELSMLSKSYEMYENTKAETREKRENLTDKNGNKIYSEESLNNVLQLMETMQKDIVDKYVMLGGDIEELKANKKTKKKPSKKALSERKKMLAEIVKKDLERSANDENEASEIRNTVEQEAVVEIMPEKDEEKPEEETIEEISLPRKITVDPKKYKGNKIKYDLIPLPSNGEVYKDKISKIPVGILTAYDENMIISPNLYEDGSFLDVLLKTKVMTDEIDPDDMLEGDRDAIILWLRASSYGTDFPVLATDPNSGIQFKTTIDLTKLSYKKFKLKGDKNGYFTFELPVSGDTIKFKFLSHKENKELEDIDNEESKKVKKEKTKELYDSYSNMLDNAEIDNKELKIEMGETLKTFKKYIDTMKDDETELFTHSVTNKLLKSIVSVNGVSDRKYIEEYITYMNVKDSSALRRYMIDNEPGVDFNVEVERPKSLGGGSFTMFLSYDQFLFLNQPE